jgi:hydroxymethylpyrimidine pyrophosphatase-like HAD family hydrolase
MPETPHPDQSEGLGQQPEQVGLGAENAEAAQQPEFDAGPVVISELSESPEGFEVVTRESVGRTAAAGGPLELDTDQKHRLAAAYQGMEKFTAIESSKEARDALEAAKQSGASEEEIASRQAEFDEASEARRNAPIGGEIKFSGGGGTGQKIGIRNVHVEGNTIEADVQAVPFPVYNELAKPGNSPEVLNLSRATGAAMIVETADERLIIQHRAVAVQRLHEEKMTRGNASYTDIPGASVAGVVDASLKSPERKPGTPDPIDTSTVKGLIEKEAGEELGLGTEHLEQVRIVGLAQDKVKPHDEFLLLGSSNLTAEQVRENSRTSNRNKNLGDADFEEKFMDIEASPAAVETLLTKVECPLPPTHAAALVAAGYAMELAGENGRGGAEAWKRRVEDGVRGNYRRMDERVTSFYERHPEALDQIPERFWGKKAPVRNQNGYDPAYAPEEQGLLNLTDEMVRTGLVPETRNVVDEAYLFDVDGVLTNPLEKTVPPEVLEHLGEKLRAGVPIALNTGRSTAWVKERVVGPLRESVRDERLLSNLVLVGEKGGTWTHFDEQGNMLDGKVKSISVPEELYERTKAVVESNYSDIMHVDETKQTMISIEINDGNTDLEGFKAAQAELVMQLGEILKATGQSNAYNVDPTTIATDIESPYVGKALGAERCLQWLDDKGDKARRYVTFGDSPSDMGMADELSRRGKDVKFVFVGDPAKVQGSSKGYEIETHEGYDQGTLRYLSSEK